MDVQQLSSTVQQVQHRLQHDMADVGQVLERLRGRRQAALPWGPSSQGMVRSALQSSLHPSLHPSLHLSLPCVHNTDHSLRDQPYIMNLPVSLTWVWYLSVLSASPCLCFALTYVTMLPGLSTSGREEQRLVRSRLACKHGVPTIPPFTIGVLQTAAPRYVLS